MGKVPRARQSRYRKFNSVGCITENFHTPKQPASSIDTQFGRPTKQTKRAAGRIFSMQSYSHKENKIISLPFGFSFAKMGLHAPASLHFFLTSLSVQKKNMNSLYKRNMLIWPSHRHRSIIEFGWFKPKSHLKCYVPGTYLYWLKPDDRKKLEVCGVDKGLVQAGNGVLGC